MRFLQQVWFIIDTKSDAVFSNVVVDAVNYLRTCKAFKGQVFFITSETLTVSMVASSGLLDGDSPVILGTLGTSASIMTNADSRASVAQTERLVQHLLDSNRWSNANCAVLDVYSSVQCTTNVTILWEELSYFGHFAQPFVSLCGVRDPNLPDGE